jgi:proline dehydrogenase
VVGRALVGEGGGALKRLMARAGEPFVRQAVGAAMKRMGEIFVMGRTIDEAMARMRAPENRGFTASFDMLGEAARTHADAARYLESYMRAIREIGRHADEGIRYRSSCRRSIRAMRWRAGTSACRRWPGCSRRCAGLRRTSAST